MTVKPAREHGKLVFIGMARDISARKLAELVSRKNQQLMGFLLNSSPIVFYTCNIKDGYSFTYVSPNVEELFGYPPETITNASAFLLRHVHPDEQLGFSATQIADFDDLSAITHPRDRDILMSAFRQRLVQDEALDIEFRILWADKSIHWIHLMGESVNDESGSPVRMVGALSDITDQKQLRVASTRQVKQAL